MFDILSNLFIVYFSKSYDVPILLLILFLIQIFCNTRKSVTLTAETLSRELTINFNAEQKAKLTALASTIKNKKLQVT